MAALTQTMTGQTITPVAGSPTPIGTPTDLTPQQEAIQPWLDQLTPMLPTNIEAKMQPLIDAARAQKVPGRMSPMLAALAAFGAPQMAPALAQHNQKVDEIQRDKDAQIIQMQQAILGAQISQDMETGKFNKALEHSKTMAMLKPITDAYEKKLALQDYQAKEDLRQKGRLELANLRGKQALVALTARARLLAKGLNIDDRLLLAQVQHIARMQELGYQRTAIYDPLTQSWATNPQDAEQITAEGMTALETWINTHQGAAPVTPGKSTTSGKALTPAERIRNAALGK
jgi:hypothetical protein